MTGVPTFSDHFTDVFILSNGHVAEIGEDDKAWEETGEGVDTDSR